MSLHGKVVNGKPERCADWTDILEYTHRTLRVNTNSETFAPAFSFYSHTHKQKQRHGGIYVSTRQVSHFVILDERFGEGGWRGGWRWWRGGMDVKS